MRFRNGGWLEVVSKLDVLSLPVTAVSGWWLRTLRDAGVSTMPASLAMLRRLGVFPIRDHYYEPLFHPRHLSRPLSEARRLPGIELDVPAQLALLSRFRFQEELRAIPRTADGELRFFYENESFGTGDAELLYNMVRLFKPRRFIEVGSGNSTLMALEAMRANRREDPGYECRVTSIEPYEAAWLEDLGVEVLRERVQDVDPRRFADLSENDILFIDSSHVVRPQGDVVCEYLQILPSLAPGVLVHVHDVFTPRDYPEPWVRDIVRIWTEQYVLEAFLTLNGHFRVLAAANLLKHDHFEALSRACPMLTHDREPGSFWIQRIA
jgi:hypothetical protein